MSKKEFLVRLGKQIKFLRLKKNLRQAELARRSMKDPQSLERIENGKVNPSAYYLYEIANGLEVPVKELFEFREEDERQ